MIRHIRDIYARRSGAELESGFTLIELLIVIVVIGILAATVIFALGGITGSSAQAACISDAKTYETAVAAYEAAPGNAANTPPNLTTDLTGGAYGQLLQQASNDQGHYVVALFGDSATLPAGTTLPATAKASDGIVYVGPPKTVLVDYNTEAAGAGCLAVK